ncbi:pantetheine-phosphate adenylyltransferase [Candidatus Woesebacteria bacterium]|nr:pantetheine-phosphate adenylyltransferase [Candidatus Woesebacteria bacterium]
MFNRVCVAGTFDGLHRGHEAMLTAAFTQGEYVIIALTSDAFVRAYKGREVAGYIKRREALVAWLQSHSVFDRSEIIRIDDPVGPAASVDIHALIVTSQNRGVGEQINTLRATLHKPPLTLIEVPLVSAEDTFVISSTRIRRGEIDGEGNLVMPDNMREELAIPLGTILSTGDMIARSVLAHKDTVIVTVGDMTTKTLIDAGVTPSLVVIDNRVNRKEFTKLHEWLALHKKTREKFVSGPGFISRAVVRRIDEWVKDTQKQLILEIDGEEDLLALPVLAALPYTSVMYYGQPKVTSQANGPIVEGVVEVVVNKQNKEIAKTLLAKFIV